MATPERGADLERRVAEPGREPGLCSATPGERRDRGGHEGEADAGAEDEQPEEDVAEVAAADGDLREQQSDPAPISAMPAAATGRKPTRSTTA